MMNRVSWDRARAKLRSLAAAAHGRQQEGWFHGSSEASGTSGSQTSQDGLRFRLIAFNQPHRSIHHGIIPARYSDRPVSFVFPVAWSEAAHAVPGGQGLPTDAVAQTPGRRGDVSARTRRGFQSLVSPSPRTGSPAQR